MIDFIITSLIMFFVVTPVALFVSFIIEMRQKDTYADQLGKEMEMIEDKILPQIKVNFFDTEGLIFRSGIAGLTKEKFWVFSLSIFIAAFLIFSSVLDFSMAISMLFACLFLLLPQATLFVLMIKRRRDFSKNFLFVVDTFVRGANAGLPVSECFKVMDTGIPEPVKGEMKKLVKLHNMGVSIQDSVDFLYKRYPLPEVAIFRSIMNMQVETGSPIAKIMGNLAKALRARNAIQSKLVGVVNRVSVNALAMLSLPFLLAGYMSYSNPNYFKPLIETTAGNIVLLAILGWVVFGVIIIYMIISSVSPR